MIKDKRGHGNQILDAPVHPFMSAENWPKVSLKSLFVQLRKIILTYGPFYMIKVRVAFAYMEIYG